MRLLLTSVAAFTCGCAYALEGPDSYALQDKKHCYKVSNFLLVYDTPHPKQIPISDLLEVPIELTSGPGGFTAPMSGTDKATITLSDFSSYDKPSCFQKSALQAICSTLVDYLVKRGTSGVVVQIAPDEIDSGGIDHRNFLTNRLTLVIRLAVVGELGTIKLDKKNLEGERNSEKRLDYILSNSPLQPSFSGEVEEADLFSKEKLDAYVYFLNRHPNRRVDARVYSLYQENKVGVDYLISESKPWRLYLGAGNTGNDVTGLWQETLGFFDTQLSGVDDILRMDWTTDSFHSFFTIQASYDRPFLCCNRVRWKVYSMFNRYAAADLGFHDKIFVGTQGIGDLSFNENIFQYKDFFIDLLEGLRYYNIHVTNRLNSLQSKGKSQWVAPWLAIHLEQFQDLWQFAMTLEGQISPNGFLASSRKNIDFLGRIDSSKRWSILNFNLFTSIFVGSQKPINEFAFLVQGQYAFHYRLIPQLKFVVGGFNTVRGYTEAINSGDNVILGRGEYLFHLPPLLKAKPHPTTKLFGKTFRGSPEYTGGRADWDFILRFFVDAARSVDNKLISPIEENSNLISTGAGAELVLWQNLMLRVDWGVALKHAVNNKVGHNVFYFNGTLAY